MIAARLDNASSEVVRAYERINGAGGCGNGDDSRKK